LYVNKETIRNKWIVDVDSLEEKWFISFIFFSDGNTSGLAVGGICASAVLEEFSLTGTDAE